jgi:hypothetical protein
MKRFFLTIIFIVTIAIAGFAQMGIGTLTPNSSSILDITSTNKAFLPPRMNTVQQTAIVNPVAGMMVYNTDSTCIETYSGTKWINLCNVATALFSGTVVAYSPIAVSKSTSQLVFAHYMPWFATPTSNTANIGHWGLHWTMNNENPNTITNGYRQIASHYYPLTGPYASSDTTIIDYQLLLMKLSGIDGVLVDWPGTGTNNGAAADLPMNLASANAFIARISKVGLKYALVYEDADLSNFGSTAAKVAQAQTDMSYAQSHYFTDVNYQKVGGVPLLLVFGPQQITTGSDWTNVLTSVSPKPSFFALWYESNEASGNVSTGGEFAWINSDNTTSLNNFYSPTYGTPVNKMTSAYPGFNTFYSKGGFPGPTWTIASGGTSNFTTTLNLALAANSHYMQIPTWNDYGEGTMIEPTDSTTGYSVTQGESTAGFGFSLLTTLQSKLGVSGLSQSDLAAVLQLYNLRQTYSNNITALQKLDQVYYYMVSLQMVKAKALLATL